MSTFIHFYHRDVPFSFEQASVYLDACFILSYFDTTETRANVVTHLINQWSNGGVRKVGISNHVFEEVVSNLFKGEICKALELYYRKSKPELRAQMTKEELNQLGDENIVKQLFEIVGEEKVRRRMLDSRYQINVRDLMKKAKKRVFPRSGLHVFYHRALNRYHEFIFALEMDFNIEVETLISEDPERMAAQAYIRLYQLDPTDALHLAIAREHEYDYLLTLDHDFVHNFYDGQLGNTRILKMA